ncbi:MAG: ATP-binding cassette domain-containing protein [Syntrophales bacterium]|nr:ATP-binding cassette domain-containing protein [Syntrophales bacterium]
MSLISLQNLTQSFGGPPILEEINLQIEQGERVCLVGRNGEGKSSLIKLIAEDLKPDSGNIIRQKGLRISHIGQDVALDLEGSVFEVIAGGLGESQKLLKKYHDISAHLGSHGGENLLAEMETVQEQLETAGGWQAQQRVETVISRLQLDADLNYSELSGGMKRRVLLASALVSDPDLLLLDEPTNHLDINAITWLEEFLLSSNLSLLFVTHDRMLLRKLATRIVNLDRGCLTSWPGNYDTYLRRKAETLAAEASQQTRFDKKLAQEEVWIRQGIKARRTRNEGRVRELVEMRKERGARQELIGTARMQIQKAVSSGKLVAELQGVTFGYGDKIIIQNLSTAIMRGERVGVIGPNGSGKTTLLRLLLGDLKPQQGTVRLGANLEVAYFDQHRVLLDENDTVINYVGEGNDTLTINGRQKHIIGYLQDFLFTPDRARSPVGILSGGERNRLLLAKLFTKPANILVLDEPTNDLDVETLELLEELLFDYKGTVLLVSHERAFLNNVVTSTLVLEKEGKVQGYAGGYDDWLMQRPAEMAETKPAPEKKTKKKLKPAGIGKLTFKEARELESLPQKIEALEAQQQETYNSMADPSFYQKGSALMSQAKARSEELEQALFIAYKRWEELEAIDPNGKK